jgi:hypothetical protein
MHVKEALRYIAKHVFELIGAHGGVRPECGEDCFEADAIVLPRIFGQVAGAGVLTALIRRNGENPIARAQLGERNLKQLPQLLL